ncbi:MAG TPA: hypothetical protein DHV44_03105 [Providencia sp.]|nr:hypothetical protein CEQ08_08640 [Providencia rettgeri]HCI95270.1 hypothetical protein [Providencia sp.]
MYALLLKLNDIESAYFSERVNYVWKSAVELGNINITQKTDKSRIFDEVQYIYILNYFGECYP